MASLAPVDPSASPRVRYAARVRRAQSLLLPAGDGRLHAKLFQCLRDMIAAGSWPPGTLLPSSRVLAQDLGLSRNTASIALEHLVAEGWAESRSRSGVFVSAQLPKTTVRDSDAGIESTAAKPVSELPTDLFPLRTWRTIQAQLWSAQGHQLLDAPEPGGEKALREVIAKLLCTARGVRADPDQVIVTGHAETAVALIARALSDQDEVCLHHDTERPSLLAALRREGLRPSSAPESADPGVTVASPSLHVPSGSTLAARERRALIEQATAGRWVIERDCGGWVATAKGRPVAPLRSESGGDNIIYVRGFDDLLFTGLPMSFVVAPAAIAGTLRAALVTQPVIAKADQLSFAAFVGQGHFAAHLRRLQRELPRRRDILAQLLLNHQSRLRVHPARLPRHLLVEPRRGCAAELANWLVGAGLTVDQLPPTSASGPVLMVGFGGLTDAQATALAARLRSADPR